MTTATATMKAIQVARFGGPEVLEPTELPVPEPGEGELRLEISAAGVNYADTHEAEDAYMESAPLPYVPGREAVGRLPDGRRVVALMKHGGYAEVATVHQAAAFELPESISDGAGLAIAIQGLTAHQILHVRAQLAPGESVVVQAAAGGVGSLAVQLAKLAGAGRVIATASSEEKRALALELGADAAIDSRSSDLTAAIIDANEGHRVDVVLEMLGGEAFASSLDALRRFGRLVTYGMASRVPPPPVDPMRLMYGSRSLLGYWLTDYFARPDLLRSVFDELVSLTASGQLRPVVGPAYPLHEARRAHEDLRRRATTGKLVLDPRQ